MIGTVGLGHRGDLGPLFRHCERSEAIQRRMDCRVATLLAMTAD
jgi:hypothetical protein